jgi:hypothetical protein
MKFLKNKFVWLGLAGVAALLALPRLDYAGRKWLYAGLIVAAWVAWGMKHLSLKLAGVITGVVAAAWAATHWLKLAELARAVARGDRYPVDSE